MDSLFPDISPVSPKLPNGDMPLNADLQYWGAFYGDSEASGLMKCLETEVDWRQEPIKLFGKEVMQPRLTALAGDEGLEYGYSGIKMKAKGWHGSVAKIKDDVEKTTGSRYNVALMNYYRDGQDSMSWHSDDEAELGRNPVIASVTLGAERVFKLRHKQDRSLKLDIPLAHGSLLLMAGETQHFWQHAIMKTKKQTGARINLTFRLVLR
jgi:alkylated DNA repair dioxygenase AlkB